MLVTYKSTQKKGPCLHIHHSLQVDSLQQNPTLQSEGDDLREDRRRLEGQVVTLQGKLRDIEADHTNVKVPYKPMYNMQVSANFLIVQLALGIILTIRNEYSINLDHNSS